MYNTLVCAVHWTCDRYRGSLNNSHINPVTILNPPNNHKTTFTANKSLFDSPPKRTPESPDVGCVLLSSERCRWVVCLLETRKLRVQLPTQACRPGPNAGYRLKLYISSFAVLELTHSIYPRGFFRDRTLYCVVPKLAFGL